MCPPARRDPLDDGDPHGDSGSFQSLESTNDHTRSQLWAVVELSSQATVPPDEIDVTNMAVDVRFARDAAHFQVHCLVRHDPKFSSDASSRPPDAGTAHAPTG
jgi:hypothetical protein